MHIQIVECTLAANILKTQKTWMLLMKFMVIIHQKIKPHPLLKSKSSLQAESFDLKFHKKFYK